MKIKKEGFKWWSDWDYENGSRERTGSIKDGNKIKLRNIGWEISRTREKRFVVKKWREGMDIFF